MQPDISVIIATYNRASILPAALDSILDQKTNGVSYEILLIDNNSTDETSEVAERYVARGNGKLRYVVEKMQGVSFARNRGLELSRAPIIAFFDDDVVVAENWIETIKRVFDDHPEVGCVGGKVLPSWQSEPPTWLTRAHWAPLALQDYGDEPFLVNFKKPLCLISANLAVRKNALNRVGFFRPELQRVKDGIGSMEDLELLMRLWRADVRTMYVPDLVAQTWVPTDRVSKNYHRKWHRGNGHFHAMLRSEEIETSIAGYLRGIPAHLYRQTFEAFLHWLKHSIMRNTSEAFHSEIKMHFFVGFARKRQHDVENNKSADASHSDQSETIARKNQSGAF